MVTTGDSPFENPAYILGLDEWDEPPGPLSADQVWSRPKQRCVAATRCAPAGTIPGLTITQPDNVRHNKGSFSVVYQRETSPQTDQSDIHC